MLKFVKKLFGTKYERDVNTYMPIVHEINEIFEGLNGLSNDELRQKTNTFQTRISEYLSEIDEVVPILQRRGRFRTSYQGHTLRHHYGLARPDRLSH